MSEWKLRDVNPALPVWSLGHGYEACVMVHRDPLDPDPLAWLVTCTNLKIHSQRLSGPLVEHAKDQALRVVSSKLYEINEYYESIGVPRRVI